MSHQPQPVRTRHAQQPSEPQPPANEGDAGPSALARRAAAYRKVAEEARSDCVSGADAQQELEQRRNSSGQ